MLLDVLITSHNTIGDFLSACLVLLGFLMLIGKSVMSIKFVTYLVQNAMFSKMQRIYFIVGFSLNLLLLVILSIFIYYGIKALVDISQYHYNRQQTWRAVTIIFFLLLFPATLILSLFDFPLLKAIRKQDNRSIETIGDHIQP
jgi:hypothetical protein